MDHMWTFFLCFRGKMFYDKGAVVTGDQSGWHVLHVAVQ